jgi:hypothetical protein
MSAAKHTPAPWFTHREGFSTVYVEACLRQGVVQEVAACGPTEAGAEQQEANARLIAAAPELLESLILMVRTHDEPAESMLQEMKEQQWLAKARAAIAKAEVQS